MTKSSVRRHDRVLYTSNIFPAGAVPRILLSNRFKNLLAGWHKRTLKLRFQVGRPQSELNSKTLLSDKLLELYSKN